MTATYVPAFQGLGTGDLLGSGAGTAVFPFTARRQHRCFRARHAIYHLFRALQDERTLTVLAPDYNSGNEVLALHASGATVRHFPVGAGAQADVDTVARLCDRHGADVLYVIHYLGWPQPIEALADLCRRREMLLVEDCALALFSESGGRPLGSFGDFSVFCLYKTLPVPNGAVLVQNRMPIASLDRLRWRQASTASVAGRTAELIVQRLRARTGGLGHALYRAKRLVGRASGAAGIGRVPVGDIGFDLRHVDLAMSSLSSHVVRWLDLTSVRPRRVRNFQRLAGRIDAHATLLARTIADGVCPLFCPVLVPDKQGAAAALRARGIEPLEFWNAGATSASDEGHTARYLRRHVLGLPVHQDLTPGQIDYMAHHVSRLQLRMAS